MYAPECRGPSRRIDVLDAQLGRVRHVADRHLQTRPHPGNVGTTVGGVRQITGFARMPDAGRIAFAAVGSGPALVMPAWWVSNVVEDWRSEPFRRFMEGLADDRLVVRYDRVGSGVSDRERAARTFTPEFELAT